MHNLLVVESPAKSKTVARYLKGASSDTYTILATGGHIYDVESKPDQVDIENGFRMNYRVIPNKKKFIDAIAKAMKQSDSLYLATDPDREGEAISQHVYQELTKRKALQGKPVHRVVFYEVTKGAVQDALNSPREISADLVAAQHARAALDYLVGFNLSPVLWRKISQKSRSAGRVQSPALRMIVERQREIDAFRPQEYWSVEADLFEKSQFQAKLTHFDGSRLKEKEIGQGATANDIVIRIEQAMDKANATQRELKVEKVERKTARRSPPPPFTTSTLVQAASSRLRMSARDVMSAAQQLYEGVSIDGQHTGLVTYIRTDSVTVAASALARIRDYVGKTYGGDRMPAQPRQYRTKSRNAQEAHEAIRPTDVFATPQKIRSQLTDQQFRLYDMIWKRTVAGQMIDATYDQVSVRLGVESHLFSATGSTLKDPGYLTVYGESSSPGGNRDDGGEQSATGAKDRALPPLEQGQMVKVEKVRAEQHFTKPPPRFNQGSLVRELENAGIGRPSTYASIIAKLQERGYAELKDRNFHATHLGCVVNDYLVEHFSQYVDYNFTANLEERLDDVAQGDKKGDDVLSEFWGDFDPVVEEALSSGPKYARKIGIDENTGRDVQIKYGKFGAYIQIGTREDEQTPEFRNLPPQFDPGVATFEDVAHVINAKPVSKELEGMPEGMTVIAKTGPHGPYLAVSKEDGTKFNVDLQDRDPESITTQDALELIQNPQKGRMRNVILEFEGLRVLKGRYGPYVTDGKVNATVPKKIDPESLTEEACRELIEKKKAFVTKTRKVLREFDGLQILDGRYGPYVTDGKINASLPKGADPERIDPETCKELLASKASAPQKRRRSTAKKR